MVVPPWHFGAFRLTPYGACAALGLLLAMALCRPSARRVGIHPEHAWDAGMFALLAALLSSRLLLVAENLKAFMQYPLLVLGLPSLTLGGLALAAAAVWVYLRRHQLPMLPLLDTFAAPGALLAAFLELGHVVDGTEVGMPSTLPWAIADPWTAGAPGAEHVQPVAVYGVLLALTLAAVLWLSMPRLRSTRGRVAALALLLGGLASFTLATASLPVPAPVNLGLEPGQWIAVLAMLAGAALWSFAPATTISPSGVPASQPAATPTEIS